MADHFVGLNRGQSGFLYSDFVTGAASTSAEKIEVRVTDSSMTDKTGSPAAPRFFENACQGDVTAGFLPIAKGHDHGWPQPEINLHHQPMPIRRVQPTGEGGWAWARQRLRHHGLGRRQHLDLSHGAHPDYGQDQEGRGVERRGVGRRCRSRRGLFRQFAGRYTAVIGGFDQCHGDHPDAGQQTVCRGNFDCRCGAGRLDVPRHHQADAEHPTLAGADLCGTTQFTADPGGFRSMFKVTTTITTGGILTLECWYVE